MRYLYIIPARGGSKGIPGKNIKPLAGKPLLCHSVDHALAAGADPADICLTTDSQQVRRVGEEYGLTVPFLRPAELSTDTAGSREVMLHALDFYEQLRGKYDAIVLLQPTSPLRTAEDIIKARELYSPEIDMVVSVTEAATNPYYNAFETAPDGTLHISKGDGLYTRRQDAPKVWEYNGAVYVINPDSLRHMPLGSFPRRIPLPMPRNRSLDLDTPLDWLLMEQLLK
ncbi:MAG: acylneuraminate cytidylyltransferase family protein [Bacteroidales bacterium]|nr:acylneuraminate cytidylyltransferase family protein [Bacteroidales bacterium]